MSELSLQKLTETQRELLLRIVEGGQSITQACRAVGTSRMNYYYWRDNDENFRSVLEWLKTSAWRDITQKPLFIAGEEAITSLQNIVTNPKAKDADKISAARVLIDALIRFAHASEVDARLQALEGQLSEDD